MVEMTEAAVIVNAATERSLVLVDEIGRGTSTFDGLSLAHAIARHLLVQRRCLTLFATHYFELTSLAAHEDAAVNLHLSATEHNGRIVFLHQVQPGPASKSHGLQVAKLAGLPAGLLRHAQTLLQALEENAADQGPQLDLFATETLQDSTVASDDRHPTRRSAKMEGNPSLRSGPMPRHSRCWTSFGRWIWTRSRPARPPNSCTAGARSCSHQDHEQQADATRPSRSASVRLAAAGLAEDDRPPAHRPPWPQPRCWPPHGPMPPYPSSTPRRCPSWTASMKPTGKPADASGSPFPHMRAGAAAPSPSMARTAPSPSASSATPPTTGWTSRV